MPVVQERPICEKTHNAEFRKLAARFCKVHGFDPKAFY
jgi:hypothetical protein